MSRRNALIPALLATLLACTASHPPPASGAPAASPGATRVTPLPGWADGAVFYEVFVRSFQDSDGDGKGDLRGLVARLDYLNDGDPKGGDDLGVDALWLMPVFGSPSYHGYDTTDYDHVNQDYGTDDDLALLVREAHRRGIRVIVDLVLNHTSREHPWFKESASSPASPRRDWYVWSPTNPHWTQPWNAASEDWHPLGGAWYYGLFWAGMPDLNFRNPAVREEMKRIAGLWLRRGVDGFRLDAVRHLVENGPDQQVDQPETHAYLREFAAYVRSVKPDAVLVGEAWTETPIIAKYYGTGGDELPLSFDFPLAQRIVAGVAAGEAQGIADKLAEIRRTYPPGAADVPFLTNHDMRRVASVLGGDAGKLRSAAAVLLTLPGTPFLYYGEEVGLLNGPGNPDEEKRTPMPWDASPGGGFTTGHPWHAFAPGKDVANVAAERTDPASLLSHYRALIRARHASGALRRGTLELVSAAGPLLAFVRTAGAESVLVVHNLGAEPLATSLPVHARAEGPLFATAGVELRPERDGVRVSLPPHGSGVFVR